MTGWDLGRILTIIANTAASKKQVIAIANKVFTHADDAEDPEPHPGAMMTVGDCDPSIASRGKPHILQSGPVFFCGWWGPE